MTNWKKRAKDVLRSSHQDQAPFWFLRDSRFVISAGNGSRPLAPTCLHDGEYLVEVKRLF